MLTAQWKKTDLGDWLPLRSAVLPVGSIGGVYVVRHGGKSPAVLRVGQGKIAEKILEERQDRAILMYEQFGPLSFTWAAIGERERGGVVRYLIGQLHPIIAPTQPLLLAVPVNLP